MPENTNTTPDPTRACPICGSDSRTAGSAAGTELRRCVRCDHCFADLSSVDEFETYGPQYVERLQAWFEHPNLELFAAVNDLIRRLAPGPRIIDLGCGPGALLRYLRDREPGLELTGVDLSPNPPEPGIEYLQADVSHLSLGREFDAVVSLATIEHMQDVRAFARTLRNLCVPRGLIIVMTVNEHSVLYRVASLLATISYRPPFERLYHKQHLNHFNVQSLRTLMEATSLEVLTTLRHNAPLRAIGIEADSALGWLVLKSGVLFTFAAGRATGMTYQQTVVCRNPVR